MVGVSTDVVKQILFDFIDNSENIQKMLVQNRYDAIIQTILTECQDRIRDIKPSDNTQISFVTGILHYVLTRALVNSQRKIEYKECDIDIVIPNLKTLERDPKRALLICVVDSLDIHTIKKITGLEKVQPCTDNIWVVLATDGIQSIKNDKHKWRVMDVSGFSRIMRDIGEFVNGLNNNNADNRLKILGI